MTIPVLIAAFAITTVIGYATDGTVPVTNVRRDALPQGCQNSPNSRGCWGNYNINTDYSTTWPLTGKTVSYTLVITNKTMAPDGTPKMMGLVNGKFPGPTIVADWGDQLNITVVNHLETNGTTIHWHGVRQLNSNIMDGVNGITECPIPPGSSRTYTFLCTQYGTSWYHSHFSAQYNDGILGGIQINGHATADYDFDLGVMPISDLYYAPFTLATYTDVRALPDDPAQNGLINGTMVSPDRPDGASGRYNVVKIQPGKKYRLRIVNTAVQDQFRVSLDNHKLQVIAADFVPIVPYSTDWLFIGIGQRYDIIIEASQDPETYWFRAESQPCSVITQDGSLTTANNHNNGNIKAIFTYENSQTANTDSKYSATTSIAPYPTSKASMYKADCLDNLEIQPWVQKDVPSETFAENNAPLAVFANVSATSIQGVNVFQWEVNNIIFYIDWANPTLKYVRDSNTSYPVLNNVIVLPKANQWVYWIITSPFPIEHPIHLHGHDFYILGRGNNGTAPPAFPGPSALNWKNPPRRDVTMLGSGWLVIGFPTDNPGAWLLHCHIAFHATEGLAVQFLERPDDIPKLMDLGVLAPDCEKWTTFQSTNPFQQGDSGV